MIYSVKYSVQRSFIAPFMQIYSKIWTMTIAVMPFLAAAA